MEGAHGANEWRMRIEGVRRECAWRVRTGETAHT
jgi:hypothetical protein